jgi:hypothetical protein
MKQVDLDLHPVLEHEHTAGRLGFFIANLKPLKTPVCLYHHKLRIMDTPVIPKANIVQEWFVVHFQSLKEQGLAKVGPVPVLTTQARIDPHKLPGHFIGDNNQPVVAQHPVLVCAWDKHVLFWMPRYRFLLAYVPLHDFPK